MKRFLILGATVLSMAVGVAWVGLGSAGAASVQKATLRDFVCLKGSDPPARGVSIQAEMRPLAATKHMAMRFDLLTRTSATGSYQAITQGDLGTWKTPSNPTLGQRPGDVWRLNKPVVDLSAPADYKFRVMFRWTGTRGRVIGTATRYSPVCFQPAPQLVVQSITVTPVVGKPKRDRYSVVIANEGGVLALGPFDVQFTDTGGPSLAETRTVQQLGAHKTRLLKPPFTGALCATGAVTVTVDPGEVVGPSNSMTAVCPTATGTATAARAHLRR
jgi:hypothetical protein